MGNRRNDDIIMHNFAPPIPPSAAREGRQGAEAALVGQGKGANSRSVPGRPSAWISCRCQAPCATTTNGPWKIAELLLRGTRVWVVPAPFVSPPTCRRRLTPSPPTYPYAP